MLKGKRLSILGDSISTYKGVSNDASINSTLFPNPFHYREPFPLEKTYWMRIINTFGMTLCTNNSWSGGNLSGRDDDSSGLNRASRLSCDSGETPDLIIVFMGLNDLGRGVRPEIFGPDYERTLLIIKECYPDAAVCCVNLPDRDSWLTKRAAVFNQLIDDATKVAGDNFFIADLFGSGIDEDVYYDNSTDGLHPDEDGMRMIAEVVEAAIRKKFNM